MSWKKSNDGGVDFDVLEEIRKNEIEERNAKKEEFNPFATAMTMTFNYNDAPLPPPKSRKQEIRDSIESLRRAKIR